MANNGSAEYKEWDIEKLRKKYVEKRTEVYELYKSRLSYKQNVRNYEENSAREVIKNGLSDLSEKLKKETMEKNIYKKMLYKILKIAVKDVKDYQINVDDITETIEKG